MCKNHTCCTNTQMFIMREILYLRQKLVLDAGSEWEKIDSVSKSIKNHFNSFSWTGFCNTSHTSFKCDRRGRKRIPWLNHYISIFFFWAWWISCFQTLFLRSKVQNLTFVYWYVVVKLNNLSLIWEQCWIYSHVMKLQVKTDIVWISAYLEFGNNTQSVKHYRSYTIAHFIFESAKYKCVCDFVCVCIYLRVLMYVCKCAVMRPF